MATIEERLNRREFEHTPGAKLFGEIVKVTEREWKFGWYPVLVVRDDEGTEHILSCYLGLSWLAEPVLTHKPKIGERIGLRCDEPDHADDGKKYNRGVVEFERDEDTEPDWERMAESRRRDRDTAPGNGGDKSVKTNTEAWKADTADTAAGDASGGPSGDPWQEKKS